MEEQTCRATPLNKSHAAWKADATTAEDRLKLIQSDVIAAAHGFLTGPQSDCEELFRVGGDAPTVWLRQVHSADVLHVTKPFAEGAKPEADGMVTATHGLRLAIVTADCAPVLFEDRYAGIIGAAHAGWRGAHGGVLENTVAAMVSLGATRTNIAAAIGPCIAQASYEVDTGFKDQFTQDDDRFFEDSQPGHFQFDLEGYAAWRLQQAGVGRLHCLGIDTYANTSDFYSYRRATHRGEATERRQFSLIALD